MLTVLADKQAKEFEEEITEADLTDRELSVTPIWISVCNIDQGEMQCHPSE